MDKKTIQGFVLIALIVIGFNYLMRPGEKQLAQQKHMQDSIVRIEKEKELAIKKDTVPADSAQKKDTASVNSKFGDFGVAATGTEQFYTLENELVKLTISNKGGRIYSVQLKKYNKRDSVDKAHPLILFTGNESKMGLTLVNGTKVINTNDLYFESVAGITKDKAGNQTLLLRLKTAVADGYLDYAYTLPPNEYMLSYGIKAHNMNKVMPASTNSLEMQWFTKIPQQERGRKFEDRYSNIQYKFTGEDIETLSETKNDEKTVSNKIKWIAFKDQFFSSILIADDAITSAKLKSTNEDEKSNYLKSYNADMTVAFDPTGKTPTTFKMFFGPNQYKVLSSYDKELSGDKELKLNKLVPLGWGIFGAVNRYAIIPMFNFFSNFFGSFGLIILLMTLVIKLVLFPLTYKSYMSSAKMRVLKPEIDEINARIPADKAMERQKATMELYSKVGVSPMSGCIPMLLQMPILIAMFSFFPSAIELRQQSFLWASDLSTYDSILKLPFTIPFGFGNHVSLFCLLMTVTNIVSTKLNMANTATPDQPGAGMMKWMMYLMPVMFLFVFNNYASGLSYYYFISSLITIAQTYAIRGFVDEKKLLAQLHAKRNSKKGTKKSGFMEKLEKMQREQQKAAAQRRKK